MAKLQTVFHIDGMTCGGCEKSVARAIGNLSQVRDVQIDRGRHQATVAWTQPLTELDAINAQQQVCASVEAAGFECRPAAIKAE